MNQSEDDYFIYDHEDLKIREWLSNNKVNSQLIPFSIEKELSKGAYKKNNKLIITINNNQFTMPITSLGLEGKHNLKNAMAAATVATLLKIRKETIRNSLENFHGVEHRLEKVLRIKKTALALLLTMRTSSHPKSSFTTFVICEYLSPLLPLSRSYSKLL